MTAALHRAYLSLGSNIEPVDNLKATTKLLALHGVVVKASRVWQSTPYGFADQPDFLNAAVLLMTPLTAGEVVAQLIPEIEQRRGRTRDLLNKNGPRTIDVDLSLYDDDRLRIHGKDIPDPAILQRLFVAQPLADIDPDYIHPVTGETLQAIARRLGSIGDNLIMRSEMDLLESSHSKS